MRVPAHLKRRYGDLIKQLIEMAAIKEKGPKEYRESNKHTRLK